MERQEDEINGALEKQGNSTLPVPKFGKGRALLQLLFNKMNSNINISHLPKGVEVFRWEPKSQEQQGS